jgi:nucleoside-diphosphate-sugar epimerase
VKTVPVEHHSGATVLVVGADEYVATRLIAALASNLSYRPVLLAAPPAPAAWPHLETRRCNPESSSEFTETLKGIDFVVNCLGGKPERFAAVTQALCDAAQRNPPRRIVHLSSMTVYGAAEGLVDEETGPEPPLNGYAKARIRCENLLKQYAADGGDAVVVRPSCIFGPGSDPWAGRVARLLLARRLGDLGPLGDGLCNLVHVDDLVAIMIAALSAPGAAGETFNATADWPRPTWNEFLVRFARAIGATPVERISARRMAFEEKLLAPALRGAALAASRIGAGRFIGDAMTPSFVRVLRQRITLSAVKTSARFGIAHMPFEQAIGETAHWWNSLHVQAAPAADDHRAEPVR